MAEKKIKKEDLNVDDDLLNEAAIHDKINMEMLIFRQIERTAQSALQDESLFAANVRVLLSMIPQSKRDEITNREDEYKSTETHWEFKHFCGVPLGTIAEPVNGSPYEVTNDVWDWHSLFEMILHALEDMGITWKRENWTVEARRIENGKPSPKPTPVFIDVPKAEATNDPTQAQANAEGSKKHLRRCGICKKHVEPGTGEFYMHRIVHKENCYDKAKATWTAQNQ